MGRARLASAAFALLGAGWPTGASAQDVKIETLDCGQRVHVVARNVRASRVLAELSRRLGFQVSGSVATDAVLSVDRTVTNQAMISALLPDQNLISTHARDSACGHRLRVTGVWLLPGTAATTPSAPVPNALAAAAAAAMAVPVSAQAREQEEVYQRAHGMLPPADDAK